MTQDNTDFPTSGHNGGDHVLVRVPRALMSALISAVSVGRNVQMMSENPEGAQAMEQLRRSLVEEDDNLSDLFFSSSKWSRVQILVSMGHPFSVSVEHPDGRTWDPEDIVVRVFPQDDDGVDTQHPVMTLVATRESDRDGFQNEQLAERLRQHLSSLSPL